MFSVLIRYRETRREALISAESVEFIPLTDKDEEPPYDKAGLLVNHGVETKGGFHLGVTPMGDENWRDVFVMNEAGQTVARYTL